MIGKENKYSGLRDQSSEKSSIKTEQHIRTPSNTQACTHTPHCKEDRGKLEEKIKSEDQNRKSNIQ